MKIQSIEALLIIRESLNKMASQLESKLLNQDFSTEEFLINSKKLEKVKGLKSHLDEAIRSTKVHECLIIE